MFLYFGKIPCFSKPGTSINEVRSRYVKNKLLNTLPIQAKNVRITMTAP